MNHPSCWTLTRRQILDWMKRNAPSLAELYDGAVRMLYDHSFPGRSRFIGHAVREIRNRLPDAFSGPTRSERLDYTKRVDSISSAWSTAGLRQPLIPSEAEISSSSVTGDSCDHVDIPANVHRLIDDLIADHMKVPETRADAASRFFEACAPENKDLRETMQPVIRHWMTVTDWFMDRTHDSGNPDAACDAEELRRSFELFESVLKSLIGSFFTSLDDLDVILAAADITQIDRAVALIARAEHHRYFFDKLDDAHWVRPLAQKGFFRSPPPLIPVQGGPYFKAPPWPESRFLARIAGSASSEEQGRIAEIALSLPDTENVSVQQDLAEIALALPPKLALRFVPKAKKWMENFTFLLVPLKLGELAVHLAAGGYPKQALDLARRVLSPLHTPRKSGADQELEKSAAYHEPRPRFEPFFYGEILKKRIPELVRAAGFDTFEMLCGLLASAIHSRVGNDPSRCDDYSTGWRPAIEDHDEDLPARDLRSMLAESVRDAAEQLAAADPDSIPRIVQELERRHYTVFDRIALHLLRVQADAPSGLVRERLILKDLFDSANHRHEYTMLLQTRFGGLEPADRDRILAWIEAGPEVERFVANHESWVGHGPSVEETERFADRYRLERLWPIRNSLPALWRQRLDSLKAQFGEPEIEELLRAVRFSGVTIEDRSPKTIDELRLMSVEDIADYVRLWEPPGGFRSPTRDGLRFVLMKLVAEEPQRFAPVPQILEQLPPAALLTVLDGFREAVIAGRTFPWPGVLDLCNRILIARTGVAETAENHDRASEQPLRLINSIAGLLESALERHPVPIPYDQRQIVEGILQQLAASPDPSEADLPDRHEADLLKTAPFDRPTRVKTLDALVFYAIWVARQLSAGQPEISLSGGLEGISVVRDILNVHLDRDRFPAFTVSAFFGRSLPKLVTLDAAWTERNLPQIFPRDERSMDSYMAAWRGYILFWKYPFPHVFRMLRPFYRSAVDRLDPTTAQESEPHDPDRRLARHLMSLYWHGLIEWTDEDSLLNRFFTRANDALRAEAIQFLGMSLAHQKSVPDEVLDRLRRLWEIRRDAKKDRSGYAQELAAFGWWPAARKFDESWAMAQLTDILSYTAKVTPEGQVLQWLAELADRLPRESIRCLELISEGSGWDFGLSVWEGHIVSILRAALRAPQSEAREAAQALIDRLGSRGQRQFRNLLQGSSGPQP
jgi:hypothetical protein